MSKVFRNITKLARKVNEVKLSGATVVAVSGGYSPIHAGHIAYIRDAKEQGDFLVVIVNGDGFLERKRGFVFMPLAERMTVVAALEGVDAVVSWDDGSQYVDGALRLLRPDVFCNGGDRSSPADCDATKEIEAMEEVGGSIYYGCGGKEKIQSSSWLIEDALRAIKTSK